MPSGCSNHRICSCPASYVTERLRQVETALHARAVTLLARRGPRSSCQRSRARGTDLYNLATFDRPIQQAKSGHLKSPILTTRRVPRRQTPPPAPPTARTPAKRRDVDAHPPTRQLGSARRPRRSLPAWGPRLVVPSLLLRRHASPLIATLFLTRSNDAPVKSTAAHARRLVRLPVTASGGSRSGSRARLP